MNLTNFLRASILVSVACVASCGSDSKDEGPSCPKDSTLTYTNFGKPFADKYCASCHAASLTTLAQRQAAPLDDVFDTVAEFRAKSDEVVHEVYVEKSMPFGPNSLKPTDAERTQFGEWMACGAKE